MTSYGELIRLCDEEIRAGQMARAAQRLRQMSVSDRIPREYILPLANVCRRAGVIVKGLRLLTPFVRPHKYQNESSAGELAEYGILLHRFGAFAESHSILSQVRADEVPEALLYMSFCHFSQWNHLEALPLLSDYFSRDLSPYMRLVGRLNYAAILVHASRYEEALELIGEILSVSEQKQHGRLMGNAYELRAQVRLHRREFSAARSDLRQATALIGGNRSFDSFFVRKWNAVLCALEHCDAKVLLDMRREALELLEWESAREADRFRLKVKFDQDLFDHLIFGTHWPNYKRMVCAELNKQVSREEYVFGESCSNVLDLATGLVEGTQVSEPLSGLCHRVVSVFLNDFYSGRRVGDLFSELFPGEYFNIFTSPGRVRQAIYRTRAWFMENAVPLSIEERGGFYLFFGTRGFGVRLRHSRGLASCGFSRQWEILHSTFAAQGRFGAKAARNRLGITRTSMQRLLKWAISQGHLSLSGPKNAVVYTFIETRQRQKDAA
jgi:tetratricopeptide (TPR) repeat protein